MSPFPQVFEQFPAFQKAGALLGMAPNAQGALRAIDPSLLAKAAAQCVPDGRSITFDHEGAIICCFTTSPLNRV